MIAEQEKLAQLLKLSHEIGLESRQLAILGEGNTSCALDSESFFVKASGTNLASLGPKDVTKVRFAPIMALLKEESLSEEAIESALLDSRVDKSHKKPSVETFLHALCLSLEGVAWVGHSHTLSVNQVLCSNLGAAPFAEHIFPDAIVVCGRYVARVAYVDPGFALALAVKAELERFIAEHGQAPKLLLMENHGPVALGASATEVLNIMLMADKWAKTLVGSFSLGGLRHLPQTLAEHIDKRLDEDYRRRMLTQDNAVKRQEA